MAEKRLFVKAFGNVQGVWYRVTSKEKGKKLGLKGYVMNCSDGTVEIEAEGNEEKLREFLEWCRKGPGLAKVDKVEVVWKASMNEFDDFRVR